MALGIPLGLIKSQAIYDATVLWRGCFVLVVEISELKFQRVNRYGVLARVVLLDTCEEGLGHVEVG